MDEPAIDDIITAPSSEVIDPKKLSWIDWYDALKEYSELIQRELWREKEWMEEKRIVAKIYYTQVFTMQ